MVESVASFTDGIRVPLMLTPYNMSKIIRKLRLLWGMAAIGEIFKFLGGSALLDSHGTKQQNPCFALSNDSSQSCDAATGSLAEGWAPFSSATSSICCVHLCPVLTGHPLIENSSSIFASGWVKALPDGAISPWCTRFHLRWSSDRSGCLSHCRLGAAVCFSSCIVVAMLAWICLIFSGVARMWTRWDPRSGKVPYVMPPCFTV